MYTPYGSQNCRKPVQKSVKSMTCDYFNTDTCSHNKTHETNGILYKKSFSHPEIECRYKGKQVLKKTNKIGWAY